MGEAESNKLHWLDDPSAQVINFKHFSQRQMAEVIRALYNNASIINTGNEDIDDFFHAMPSYKPMDINSATELAKKIYDDLVNPDGWSRHNIDYIDGIPMKILFLKDKEGNLVGYFKGYDEANLGGPRLVKQLEAENISLSAQAVIKTYTEENKELEELVRRG